MHSRYSFVQHGSDCNASNICSDVPNDVTAISEAAQTTPHFRFVRPRLQNHVMKVISLVNCNPSCSLKRDGESSMTSQSSEVTPKPQLHGMIWTAIISA